MATLNRTITASADDAQETSGTSVINGTALNANAVAQYIGLRFQNITIPPGSTINSATFEANVTSGSFDDPDVTIYAHDHDDAPAFTTTTNDISGRTLTTASTVWNASGIGTGYKTSPGIAAVIQEVIDRPGWASGNDLAVIIKGNSGSSFYRIESYDAGGGNPANLIIDYTPMQTLTGAFIGSTLAVFAGALSAGEAELDGAFITSTLQLFAGTLHDNSQELAGAFIDSTLEMWPGRMSKHYGLSSIANMTHYEGEGVNTASFDHETPPGENRALLVFATYYDAIGVTLAKWGSVGSGDGQFDLPNGIAIAPDGTVYVTDGYNHRIQVFDADGVFIRKWGSNGSGDGQFAFPNGIALAANGDVYVTDQNNHRIQVFDADGTFIRKWGSSGSGNGQFAFPNGIALAANGNVYVADRNNHRIQVFDSAGAFIRKWGSFGSGDGQFSLPFSVTVATSGDVYVADEYNSRIQVFDADGTFIRKWGSFGSGDVQFSLPRSIAVAANGDVYVVDGGNNRIQVFDSAGVFIRKWGSYGSGDGQFDFLQDITIAPNGNVYVADGHNYRIQVFDDAFSPVAPYCGDDQLEMIQYVDAGAYFQGVYLLLDPPVGTQRVAFGPSGAPATLMMTAFSLNEIELALTDYTAPDASIGAGLSGSSAALSTSQNRTYADDTLTMWSALHETAAPVTYTPQTGNEVIATRNVGDLTYTMGLRYEPTGATGSRTFGATASSAVARKSIVLIHLEGARTRVLWGARIPSGLQVWPGEIVATAELEGAFIDSTLVLYPGDLSAGPGQMQYIEGVFIGLGSPSAMSGAFIDSTLEMWPGEMTGHVELAGAFIDSTMELYGGGLVDHATTITAGIWPGTLVQEVV